MQFVPCVLDTSLQVTEWRMQAIECQLDMISKKETQLQ